MNIWIFFNLEPSDLFFSYIFLVIWNDKCVCRCSQSSRRTIYNTFNQSDVIIKFKTKEINTWTIWMIEMNMKLNGGISWIIRYVEFKILYLIFTGKYI